MKATNHCFWLILIVCILRCETSGQTATLIAPTDLKVAVVYGNFVGLTWTDTSMGEDSWWLEYRSKRNGAWTTLTRQPGNSSSYGFRGAKPHTRYEFRIKACLKTQCSGYSNTVIYRHGWP